MTVEPVTKRMTYRFGPGQFDLYNPNLLIVGDRDILRDLIDASPRTQVTLFGYVHSGARRMLVVEVDAA